MSAITPNKIIDHKLATATKTFIKLLVARPTLFFKSTIAKNKDGKKHTCKPNRLLRHLRRYN